MTEVERDLWKKVEKVGPYLHLIPFLRFAGVCNTLSFGLVDKDSDIDLFIVAKGGRLFIMRIFLVALLHIMGVRGYGDKFTGRFCLSFFVDDRNLDLSEIALSKDIYLAFWLKKMIPVIDMDVFTELMECNAWMHKYFDEPVASNKAFAVNRPKVFTIIRSSIEWVLNGFVGGKIEEVLSWWQIKRATKKAAAFKDQSGLIIKKGILKFHHNDRRGRYSAVWREKFGDDSITDAKFWCVSESLEKPDLLS